MPTRVHRPGVVLGLLLSVVVPAQQLDYEAAAAYSAENAGLCVLVYEDGECTFERYEKTFAANRTHHVFSGTKSFAPIVALIAQQEGLLTLDEKVADTIKEWQGDERREAITIRHLLQFTSGLEPIDDVLHSAATRDKHAAAIACRCVAEPGKRFRYGSNHLTVFGELLERKLRAAAAKAEKGAAEAPLDFVAYLEQRVLGPIGCEHGAWLRDAERHPMIAYGAFFTAREWAKYGLLLQRGGTWGERTIVPEEALAECFVGSAANPTYGLNFWLIGKALHRRQPTIPEDLVSAAGMYDQRLYVSRERRLVVVRFGRTAGKSGYSDAGFLTALLPAAKEQGQGGDEGRGR
jgi:CubicO group peptidase (beta-lactamase class C family)